ncbi:hypothetical protein [Endozoicomonas lisbonensis]|uniref:Uncharacterized protein n=1 Tax=Endozoicomonas lisbonensis TaxID=3120522 RepID=A0ABV2SCV5_9GAMM
MSIFDYEKGISERVEVVPSKDQFGGIEYKVKVDGKFLTYSQGGDQKFHYEHEAELHGRQYARGYTSASTTFGVHNMG